jgi:hypothetical protein
VERNLGSCKTPFDPQWRRQILKDLDTIRDFSRRPSAALVNTHSPAQSFTLDTPLPDVCYIQ